MRIREIPEPDDNDPGFLRRDARETEEEAARCVFPRTGTQRMAALTAFADHVFGLTDSEMAAITGLGANSYRPRRIELVENGWVEDSGRKRPNYKGNDETIWRITPEGRKKWRERS